MAEQQQQRVKISFEGATKAIDITYTFSGLVEAVKQEFPQLQNSPTDQIVITTLDEEGDSLLVDSVNSFMTAVATTTGAPRFTVTKKGASTSAAQAPSPEPTASSAAAPPNLADLLPLLGAAGITPQAAQRMAATFLPMAAQAFTQVGSASSGAAGLGNLLRTVLGSSGGAAPEPAPSARDVPIAETPRTAPAASTSNADGTAAPSVHTGVQCDGCGMNPITGPRYKDAARIDYDLCQACEASGAGDSSGPWLKIRSPEQAPALLICVPRGGNVPPGCGPHGGWGRCGGGRGGRGAWRRARHRHQQQQQEQQQQQAATPPAATETTDNGAQTTSFSTQMEQAILASINSAVAAAEKTEATTTTTSETDATTATPPAAVEVNIGTEDATVGATDTTTAAPATFGSERSEEEEYDILDTTPLLSETTTTPSTTTATATEATETTATTEQQQQQQRAKRWQKEIVSLASMGFVDFAKNLDLLEQHIGAPGGGGMDRVLDVLLTG